MTQNEPRDNATPLTIDNQPLEETDHFAYLGSIISQDGSIDRDIGGRIHSASRAFGRLRERVFLNKDLRIDTKVSVYSTKLFVSQPCCMALRRGLFTDVILKLLNPFT